MKKLSQVSKHFESSMILKSAELDKSFNESTTIKKFNTTTDINERKPSIGRSITMENSSTSKDENSNIDVNQPFPNIEESGVTIHKSESTNNYENATYSLLMDTSFNINIFSGTSNSSNIYSSNSSEITSSSEKYNQSIEIKLNIESSEIKKIIFDQIFRELVIPEEIWTDVYIKMNNFNDKYIEYFKKIYDIYINPKGVVPMKLKENSSKAIGTKISKSEYSYDMFFPSG